MRLCIDRFEEEYAVCIDESNQTHIIRRETLPAESGEGDWLTHNGTGWTLDLLKTQSVKTEIKRRMDALWK